MKKNTTYIINNKQVNIDSLAKKYNGNMQAVCFEIENQCLVNRNISSYYVNLYLQDKPFKAKCATLSIIAVIFSFILVTIQNDVFQLFWGIITLAIIISDLITKNKQIIPKKHFLTIIAMIFCASATISCLARDDEASSKYNTELYVESTDTTENTPNSEDTDNKIKVGEEYIYHDEINVKFSNYYEVKKFEWNKPQKGNKVIAFDLEITNNSNDDFDFFSYFVSCYADNVKTDIFWDNNKEDITLSPGRTGNVTIAFEVPKNAKNIEMEYEFNSFSEEKAIFISQ